MFGNVFIPTCGDLGRPTLNNPPEILLGLIFRSGLSEWMLSALLKHGVWAVLKEAPASFNVIQKGYYGMVIVSGILYPALYKQLQLVCFPPCLGWKLVVFRSRSLNFPVFSLFVPFCVVQCRQAPRKPMPTKRLDSFAWSPYRISFGVLGFGLHCQISITGFPSFF